MMPIARKRDRDSVRYIVERELLSLHRHRRIESFFFSLFVVSLLSLSFVVLSAFFYTGYVSYIDATAGSVTTAVITANLPTSYWHGLHGLALRVPGYLTQIYTDVSPGEISSVGLFFDCIQEDAQGGREIYASNESTIDFNNLVPATAADIDAYLGCSGGVDCADNTFTENLSVVLGATNITNVPGTYTNKWDGSLYEFDIGVLKDGSTLVFFTHLLDSIDQGYSENVTVNFQMLLPVAPNSTERYYFFSDPFDDCPEGGGVGNVILARLFGFITDPLGAPVPNATVIFVGNTTLSNASGLYNVSASVVAGTYNIIVRADGFDDYVFNATFNFTNATLYRNVTLSYETPGSSTAITPTVIGNVTDESGNRLANVTILLGDSNATSDANGTYTITPSVSAGLNPIIAYKSGYENYYALLELNATGNYEHNIILTVVVDPKQFDTGPFTTDEDSSDATQQIIQEILHTGEDHWISEKDIYKEIRKNTFLKEELAIYNFRAVPMTISLEVSPELAEVVELDSTQVVIEPQSLSEVGMTFYGIRELGDYNGTITLSGDLETVIPTFVKIVEKRQTIETLLIDILPLRNVVPPGDILKYKVSLHNLLSGQRYDVYLRKFLTSVNGTYELFLGDERVEVLHSLSFLENVVIPENLSDGDYQIRVDASYLNYLTRTVAPFEVRTPIYLYSFFGIPVWLFLVVLATLSFLFLVYFMYRREMEKRKRYRNALDFGNLPKKDDHSLWLGRIAESKVSAFLNLNNLTTHAIVAGATGGGKSISAQVLVEEVLKQNVAVLVFDPTAQWSGMLRKCEDKKMLSFYPKFKLKPTDARAFPGSIRLVTDARQLININKYMSPGQIQIFALNKLDPKDMDIFVANVIRQIFRSDPKESPDLKVLLVFDEVHRLLSKFGGSGEGFLQIERACREFRKWGIGVMLVSQVLSDFVGEIKANINTEVQMRTIEENDLERIKTKYGPEFLKSLVKSEVGVGMIQNAEYNNGKPYFLQFRPILHNTRRLSDEELAQYNDYNMKADQIDFEITELEKKKIDVFDLKMELKLVKDKIMTGNFSVVDIYLQGLRPRLDKQWQKLGEKAPAMKIQMVSLDDIKKSVEEAKQSRTASDAATNAASSKKQVSSQKTVKSIPPTKQDTP